MIYRGYSVLALLALLAIVAGLGLALAGLLLRDWWLVGGAGVVAVTANALTTLSALDG